MKKYLLILLCMVFVTGCLAGCGTTKQKINEKERGKKLKKVRLHISGESYEPLKQFSYELLKKNSDGVNNPILSPVSAYRALSMAAAGSSGKTKEEFQNVLGVDNKNISRELYDRFSKKTHGMEMKLADSAWVSDDCKINDTWKDAIETFFGADVISDDLTGKSVVEKMNQWVDENTNGLIPNMVKRPFTPDIRFVLFDTIYWKAKWAKPFESYKTYEDDFVKENGEKEKVSMMNEYGSSYSYIHNDTMDGVVLPYQNKSYAFVAIKPTDDKTIREMAGGLNTGTVQKLLKNKKDTKINLKLPKLEIKLETQLKKSLIEMGMASAFDVGTAEFSNMIQNEKKGIFISNVKQRAVIKVDEEGTEAAAATQMDVKDSCPMEVVEPKEVFFNRPFVYLLMDMEKEVPIFIGIMDRP